MMTVQREADTTKTNTVYISNLSYQRDKAGLRSLFSKYGAIKNIKIIVDPSTNNSKGMAFVEMGSMQEAKAAIAGLNQQNIDGRTVKATHATQARPIRAFYRTPVEEETKATPPRKDADRYLQGQMAKKARNFARKNKNPFV